MTQPPTNNFDHEKLDVYQVVLEFLSWVTELLTHLDERRPPRTREVCDQLDRASLSICLNIAEGNGKRQRKIRAKFFDDARGSATECAACLDALVAKQACSTADNEAGKKMLLRIVSMLSKLVDKFDQQVREESAAYGGELDSRTRDEDELEDDLISTA